MKKIYAGFAAAFVIITAVLAWQLFLSNPVTPGPSNGPESPGNESASGNNTTDINASVDLVADYVGDQKYDEVDVTLEKVVLRYDNLSRSYSGTGESYNLYELQNRTLKTFEAPRDRYTVYMEFSMSGPDSLSFHSEMEQITLAQRYNVSEGGSRIRFRIDSGPAEAEEETNSTDEQPVEGGTVPIYSPDSESYAGDGE